MCSIQNLRTSKHSEQTVECCGTGDICIQHALTDLEGHQRNTKRSNLLLFFLLFLGIFLNFPKRFLESNKRGCAPVTVSGSECTVSCSFLSTTSDLRIRMILLHRLKQEKENKARQRIFLLRLQSFAFSSVLIFFLLGSFCYLRIFWVNPPHCSRRQQRPAKAIARTKDVLQSS